MKPAKSRNRGIHLLLATATVAAGLSCSSDFLNPPKAPEIESLLLSAYEVDPDAVVTAQVSVKNSKDQTLRYEWTTDNGRFIPPLDNPKIEWKAPAVGGVSRISVKVSNPDKSSSRSQTVTVRSFTNPDVNILSPADGEFFVQHTTLSVSARARHDNGIARVDLYVNRIRKATLNGHASEAYAFTCALDEPSGPAIVKIEAIANVTGKAGKDSVRIRIEGVVLGKPGR